MCSQEHGPWHQTWGALSYIRGPRITTSGSTSLLNVSNLMQTTNNTQYGSNRPEPPLCLCSIQNTIPQVVQRSKSVSLHGAGKSLLWFKHSLPVDSARVLKGCCRVKKQNGKGGRTRLASSGHLLALGRVPELSGYFLHLFHSAQG